MEEFINIVKQLINNGDIIFKNNNGSITIDISPFLKRNT
jgi:hypothetical protein